MKRYKVAKPYSISSDAITYDTEVPHPEAAFAMDLIRAHSLIVAVPSGEDSSGRAKCSPAPAEEIVFRACKISELAFKAFREKGWMLEVPAPIFKEERTDYQDPGTFSLQDLARNAS